MDNTKNSSKLNEILSSDSFLKDLEGAMEEGHDVGYNEGGGYSYFSSILAIDAVIKVLEKHFSEPS